MTEQYNAQHEVSKALNQAQERRIQQSAIQDAQIAINKVFSPVHHPGHYGGESNVYEVIKIIEHFRLNFNRGNVIKYTLRAGRKHDELEDLRKAAWCAQREVERFERELKNESTVP